LQSKDNQPQTTTAKCRFPSIRKRKKPIEGVIRKIRKADSSESRYHQKGGQPRNVRRGEKHAQISIHGFQSDGDVICPENVSNNS